MAQAEGATADGGVGNGSSEPAQTPTAPESIRMLQEADDALIAQLLAEEDGYAAGPNPYKSARYSNKFGRRGNDSDDGFGHEDSDEYGKPSRRKGKGGRKAGAAAPAAAGKKRKRSTSPESGKKTKRSKAAAAAASASAAGDGDPRADGSAAPMELLETGSSALISTFKILPMSAPADPVADAGAVPESGEKKRKTAQPWTLEEEAVFLEGLELHGRNWKGTSDMLGTRDHKAVASHAQKHFIRLARMGKPLPDKVRESGEGYTLSGKPLAIDSAAARSYFKDSIIPIELPEGAVLPAALDENGNRIVPLPPVKEPKPPKPPKEPKPPKPPKEPKPPKPPKVARLKTTAVVSSGEMRRSARESKGKRPLMYGEAGELEDDDEDDLDNALKLIKAAAYDGDAHSGVAEAQPFALELSTGAIAVMDAHAHLSSTEIIGWLGGLWDPAQRRLAVHMAVRCVALGSEESTMTVEMEPESAVAAKQAILAQGLVVVGWYHSHPVFEPDPSVRDIANQANYQTHTTCEENNHMPFVGAILGPYDLRLPSPQSVLNIFHVQTVLAHQPHGAAAGLPRSLVYRLRHEQQAPDGLGDELLSMVQAYAEAPSRIDPAALWRYEEDSVALSKADKLAASLTAWIEEGAAAEGVPVGDDWRELMGRTADEFRSWPN